MEDIRSFVYNIERWKQKKFEKKQSFQWRKVFDLRFSRIIECDKPQGIVFKSPQGFLTVTVWGKRSIL